MAAYQLFVDKEEYIIKIEPLKAVFQHKSDSDEIRKYNEYYYFCNNRKALKELAESIKQEWIDEARARLDAFERTKIINRY